LNELFEYLVGRFARPNIQYNSNFIKTFYVAGDTILERKSLNLLFFFYERIDDRELTPKMDLLRLFIIFGVVCAEDEKPKSLAEHLTPLTKILVLAD